MPLRTTRETLHLACLMHFPSCSLYVFFLTSLNERTKECLPRDGPRLSFGKFVEWVLVNTGSPSITCLADEANTSPTQTLSPPILLQPPSQTNSQSPPQTQGPCLQRSLSQSKR